MTLHSFTPGHRTDLRRLAASQQVLRTTAITAVALWIAIAVVVAATLLPR